jgi:hypothetical protein
MANRELTPDERADLITRMSIARMTLAQAKLTLGIAYGEATIAMRGFVRTVRAVEAAQFDELREHPDVLELDVATASWYPSIA